MNTQNRITSAGYDKKLVTNGANGAYAAELNTIYLSQEFITRNADEFPIRQNTLMLSSL